MFCEDVCLGTSCGIDKIRALSDDLNAKVVDKVNVSQELVMLTGFARESNEYQYQKCLQDRISDVTSWHWVLEDLSKRLEESMNALKHEHNALRVVVQRIQEELNCHSREGSRPGAICPLTDLVEQAIMQEYNFLRDQKKSFEKLVRELETQTAMLGKTKRKIETDVLHKQQALKLEETCATRDYTHANLGEWKRRKKGFSVANWVKRCSTLKRNGLKALYNAVITRQQIRGARVRLSIDAQAYATKVDAVLRRRLHTNKLKLQDLNWQREEITTCIDNRINKKDNVTLLEEKSRLLEINNHLPELKAVRDYNSLLEELSLAEKTLVESMDQERIVAARLMDRSQRPDRELTKDDVNRKLRDEQNQLRKFAKELRHNVEDIIALQNNLTDAISHIDCYAEDILQVIRLDEERLRCRQGEIGQSATPITVSDSATRVSIAAPRIGSMPSEQLTVIQEENEDDDDDYPFDF